MLGTCNDAAEKLYLQKDSSGDISVPCTDLAQHQIDGVRFLFSQYKKEKLGVILNYPPGCGSSVQVVIFISAICDKLERPVLILYSSEQEKEAWLARFAKWTSISEDAIEVDTSNPYVRKQIFIKNIADVAKFYRRSWSIVVVKSDSFLNVFKKCQLKVDYKIWITAQDLKQNRELLHSVYTWINPSDKLLHVYLSRESPKVFKEDTSNEILLDLLLEDFLITRSGLKPFGALKRKQDPEIPVLKVSKKNKDATGKKIKRSKKYQEDPSLSTIRIESVVSLHDSDNSFESSNFISESPKANKFGNNFTINEDRTDNDDEESKMDVESFIRDNDPLKSDINFSFAINNLDSTSQPSATSSPKAEETFNENPLNFANAIADIIRIGNDEPADACDDSNSVNAEVTKDASDINQDVTEANVNVEESNIFNRIDLSKPVIQKVFFLSSQDKTFEPDLDDVENVEDKTDKKYPEEERNANGAADQTSKLEVSSNVMNETESSFESKMKEFEERALRKFKGSVLDNIF